MEINFIGEHLWPGYIGHFAVILSFTLSILSFVSYYISIKGNDGTYAWHMLGRWSFRLHSLTVFAVVASLFYIIYNHLFEYYYAWSHSSTQLPPRYMLSCFWEGQEGSFLLWIFWQVVLGNLLIFTSRDWEKPVMAVIALSQIALTSMLLGIVIGDLKIGSSPFILLREVMTDAPIFKRPEYLSLIADGNGLNPLLQNYWMTIHPPTLFFGFASTVVPFAFAIAGLYTKRYSEWIKPALPWALLSMAVLGVGIIMGGAWAYESLSFGGYWAWDPVENASIVPWLVLVGGVHTMVIFQSSKNSLKTAFLLIVCSFLFVLYATFLTRSGILGESSVHSFTDLGLSGQLLVFLFLFIGLTIGLLILNWRKIPTTDKDEETWTREFWMFIGALLLLLSAIHIIAVTSLPVWNKIFGTKMAPPANVFDAYHSVQIPVAVIIGLLTAFTQFLKYKNSNLREFATKNLFYLGLSILLGVLLFFSLKLDRWVYAFLSISTIYAIIANTIYMFDGLKGKLKFSGASIAHIGFALMLLGALISSAKKNVISENLTGVDLGDKTANAENILLIKNQTMKMKSYLVTYTGDSVTNPDIFYKVHYQRVDDGGKVLEDFVLTPNAQINPKMGLVANPDTKHYLTHDVFTHVTSVPNRKEEDPTEGFSAPQSYQIKLGDTIVTKNSFVVYSERVLNLDKNKYDPQADVIVGAQLDIYTKDGNIYKAVPVFGIKQNFIIGFDEIVKEAGLRLSYSNVIPALDKIEITVSEKEPEKDFIIMKAIVFPFINILWLGTIVTAIGTFIAFWRRAVEWRKKLAN